MLPIEPLGLSANQWKFLSTPETYVEASKGSDRELVLESTRRQFLTAADILRRLNGSNGEPARRGQLLADDVGLGKTTVAALVAWIVAAAGDGRTVRILAPNVVMQRRWADEMHSHVELLNVCASHLDVRHNRIKVGKVGKLKSGSIQIIKHSYAAKGDILNCDLLIVDEAHRAKGDSTAFSKALKRQKKHAGRILILTATPFSIRLEELERMLTLVGGEAAHGPVRNFSRALDRLYSGNTARAVELVAERLATRAKAAVEALSLFVIRHGIDDLPREQHSFGLSEDWNIDVPQAKPSELELLIRMDRVLRVARDDPASSRATNDPRFHVGWRHFDAVRKDMESRSPQIQEPAKRVATQHLKCITRLRREVNVHSKLEAVGVNVQSVVDQGEKVVLFCHHIATAQELTVHLASVLPKITTSQSPSRHTWRQVWSDVLEAASDWHEQILRDAFINWLCAEPIRSQTWTWLPAGLGSSGLADALRTSRARNCANSETIVAAAQHLYHSLVHSRSSKAVLTAAAECPDRLSGAIGAGRVLGVCEKLEGKEPLFSRNQQPDTDISIFSSPFGPDALVVTDKLSEGIDLHRYCRHLIHYELDPSPIRTVQRNGRIRRVNSWAAATRRPVLYSYPAFRGTRDHRLVQIMKKRIDSFSLLLGGVRDFDIEEVIGSEEEWRNQVIDVAKTRLEKTCGRLTARGN